MAMDVVDQYMNLKLALFSSGKFSVSIDLFQAAWLATPLMFLYIVGMWYFFLDLSQSPQFADL